MGKTLWGEKGIQHANTKEDRRPDIPENRIPYGLIELAEVLMREGQGQPVLPHLGEHVGCSSW